MILWMRNGNTGGYSVCACLSLGGTVGPGTIFKLLLRIIRRKNPLTPAQRIKPCKYWAKNALFGWKIWISLSQIVFVLLIYEPFRALFSVAFFFVLPFWQKTWGTESFYDFFFIFAFTLWWNRNRHHRSFLLLAPLHVLPCPSNVPKPKRLK